MAQIKSLLISLSFYLFLLLLGCHIASDFLTWRLNRRTLPSRNRPQAQERASKKVGIAVSKKGENIEIFLDEYSRREKERSFSIAKQSIPKKGKSQKIQSIEAIWTIVSPRKFYTFSDKRGDLFGRKGSSRIFDPTPRGDSDRRRPPGPV